MADAAFKGLASPALQPMGPVAGSALRCADVLADVIPDLRASETRSLLCSPTAQDPNGALKALKLKLTSIHVDMGFPTLNVHCFQAMQYKHILRLSSCSSVRVQAAAYIPHDLLVHHKFAATNMSHHLAVCSSSNLCWAHTMLDLASRMVRKFMLNQQRLSYLSFQRP